MLNPWKIAITALAVVTVAFAAVRISRDGHADEQRGTPYVQAASVPPGPAQRTDAETSVVDVHVSEPKPAPASASAAKTQILSPKIDYSHPTVSRYDPRQRYIELQKVDEIEPKTTSFLMVAPGERISFWLAHSAHESGAQTTSLHIQHLVSGVTPSARLMRSELSPPSEVSLKYRKGTRSFSVPCTGAKRDPQYKDDGTEETFEVPVSPEVILDISDAGAFRMSGYSDADMKLDQDDVAAIRWFVWSKVPGGEKLMRDRYDIVDAAR